MSNPNNPQYTNELIRETSPYLLQHAHNPVNWVAWSEEAFAQAKREDKLVLVSIGYSACHWCHVMEHESFEDEEVATWMNRHFVCIKVDREERPDVDQVYMAAVQLMTQRGGWPLNCFTLPDGRPVYGGTYFQKEHWIQILRSLHESYQHKREEFETYAQRLQEGVQQSELIAHPEPMAEFNTEKLDELVLRWKHQFDQREGGSNRAPKFMLPNNYEFLLQYAAWRRDESVLKQVQLTLHKMALGGIYDQLGGGFCRYSVDVLWKVPHFEKMLYDNAQMLSLYAQAYQHQQHPEYRRILEGIVSWIDREMTSPEGACYSALDADSEGEEGLFYTWEKAELEQVLGEDFPLAAAWYEVNQLGHWEHGRYILLRKENAAEIAQRFLLSEADVQTRIQQINAKLLAHREQRIRPGLDNKCLTSWNAMLISGLLDACDALGDDTLLYRAIRIGRWILQYQRHAGGLWHNRNQGKSGIDGFLEDYAHVIKAFTHLYQHTFDESWLNEAEALMQLTIDGFHDPKGGMFYFTDRKSTLIARKMDINDNVIPAANSVMCRNLQALGSLLDRAAYRSMARQMISNVYEGMEQYGSGYSNWAQALLAELIPSAEVVITGNKANQMRQQLARHYLPFVFWAGGTQGTIALLEGKDHKHDAMYVCQAQTCSAPETDPGKMLKKLKELTGLESEND